MPDGREFAAQAKPDNFGFYSGSFFPKDAGENDTSSEYLELLNDLRSNFTVFSGMSHPDIGDANARKHGIDFVGAQLLWLDSPQVSTRGDQAL